MKHIKTWRKVGIVGTVVAALCCFTPVLVILLGTVGLSAWVGYLDYVLLPALVVFLGLTIVAFLLRPGRDPSCRNDNSRRENR